MLKIKFNNAWVGSVWSLANVTYYNDAGEIVTDTTLATQYQLADGVVTFEEEAFLDCVELVQITVADTITSFGVNCFTGCMNLTDIFVSPATSLDSMKTIMEVNNSSVVSLMKGVTGVSNAIPANFLADKDGKFVPVAHADSTFVSEFNSEGKSKTLTEKLAEIVATSGVTVAMLTEAIDTHDKSNTAHAQLRAILDTCVGQPEWDETTYTLTFTTKAGTTAAINIPIEQIALSYNSTDNAIEFIDAQGDLASIPVIDFIEIYTGFTGTEIQITIDSGNVIKATIIDNSIAKSKLSYEVQTSLDSIANKLDSSEIADWAKADEKPEYTPAEIGAYSTAEIDAKFTVVDGEITAIEGRLDGIDTKLVEADTKFDEIDSKLLETIKVDQKIGEVSIVI